MSTGLIIGLFVMVAIAAVIVWVADYTSVPRRRIEEIKKRLNDERRI